MRGGLQLAVLQDQIRMGTASLAFGIGHGGTHLAKAGENVCRLDRGTGVEFRTVEVSPERIDVRVPRSDYGVSCVKFGFKAGGVVHFIASFFAKTIVSP